VLHRKVAEVAAAALLSRHWPERGGRNDAFLALAGALLRSGWEVERTERFVKALAETTGDEEASRRVAIVPATAEKIAKGDPVTGWPTLDEILGQDVGRRLRDVLRIEPNEGEVWPERPLPLAEAPAVPPFPRDVLPQVINDFVCEAAAALNCPVDYVAVPLLTVAGGAIGATRALGVTETHTQRSALYAAVIGHPGTAKTPALQIVMEPIRDLEHRQWTAWRESLASFQADMDRHEEELKLWKKDPVGERPAEPQRPVLERRTVNDATVEAILPIMAENPRGVTLARDELAGFVGSINEYKRSGRGADQQFYLSAWSGDDVTVDRKAERDRGPLRVRQPFLAIVGGLTPDRLSTLRGDRPGSPAARDGFIDRFLFASPAEPPAAADDFAEVSAAGREAWRSAYNRLCELSMVDGQTVDGLSIKRPYTIHLTTSARAEWRQFTVAHAAEVNAEDFPTFLSGPWSKLRGYVVRLALIVHYLRWAVGEVASDTADVDAKSMRAAVQLVTYFKAHARKVYAAIDADPRASPARKLLNWIRREGCQAFTKRDAYRAIPGTIRTVDGVDPVLSLLSQHGFVRLAPPATDSRAGRKPSPKYEVHPCWLSAADDSDVTVPEDPGNSVQSVHSVPSPEVYEEEVA
jgi:hypothetical protein